MVFHIDQIIWEAVEMIMDKNNIGTHYFIVEEPDSKPIIYIHHGSYEEFARKCQEIYEKDLKATKSNKKGDVSYAPDDGDVTFFQIFEPARVPKVETE